MATKRSRAASESTTLTRLRPGELVRNLENGHRFRLADRLGEGGYGQTFLAERLDRYSRVEARVCLKATLDKPSWHRECYFGELLRGNRRVIQMQDSFALAPVKGKRRRMVYCMIFELAEKGSVMSWLERSDPWPEHRVRRETAALLKVLDQLHSGSATHRDLTPGNIFVTRNGILKLGDFGIASHSLPGKPTMAEAFNSVFVTRGVRNERHRAWLAVDDVFQMGQLMAMLLRGEAHRLVSRREVNRLECSAELRAVIAKAIAPRSRRFHDAFEMLEALRGIRRPTQSLESLAGRRIVLCGRFARSHLELEGEIVRVGGLVASEVTPETDVVVLAGRRPGARKGRKPSKLKAAEAAIRQGQELHLISSAELDRLLNQGRRPAR